MDLQILKVLLDNLFLAGQLDGFEKTLVVAIQEAEQLDNQIVLSDLILISAQFDYLQGRYIYAKEKLEAVIKNKSQLIDKIGLTKAYVELAKLEKSLYNTNISDDHNEKALAIAKECDYHNLQAEILNNMAISKKEKKLIDEAILLYDESLMIANKVGDKTGISKILFNKANILKEKNRLDEAEKMYKQSLDILRTLGDKRRIACPLS